MKTLLSLVMVLLMAGVVMAQPPQRGHGQRGMSKGQPAQMQQMQQKRMEMMRAHQGQRGSEARKGRGGPPQMRGHQMRGQGRGMQQRHRRGRPEAKPEAKSLAKPECTVCPHCGKSIK